MDSKAEAHIDQHDQILLSRLAADGRLSWAELGVELGLSPPAVAERVKRLRQRGLITGFHAILHPPSLGLGLLAFIAVSLTHPRNRGAFLKVLLSRPEVAEAHHVAGDDDFLLKVYCRDTAHLEHFLTTILKTIPGVQRTRTSITLGTLKSLPTALPPE